VTAEYAVSDHQKHRPERAFFGRRKGHPLRPRQAALFDTLLPRLALDLSAPPRPISAACSTVSTRCGWRSASAAAST
jgi:hypothetical protein